MFNFWKKSIRAEEAVVIYTNTLVRRYELNWEDQIHQLNSMFGEILIHPDHKLAEYEFMLCTIAIELRAIENIVPEKYNILYKALILFLTDTLNTGEYTKIAISHHYLPIMRKAELLHQLPHEAAVFLLLEKLDLERNLALCLALSEIVLSHIGTWKDILKKYDVV